MAQTPGNTQSTKCAARSVIRRTQQLGQSPHPLQEKGTSRSKLHGHRSRAKAPPSQPHRSVSERIPEPGEASARPAAPKQGVSSVSVLPDTSSFPAFFVSADWGKNAGKRSVHVADLPGRRIWREEYSGWTLTTLLKLAGKLARRGSVLVGIDAALGVPAGYWGAVQAQDRGMRAKPADFIHWLSRLDSVQGFFEPVGDPAAWRVDRPFFRVPGRKGGLSDFTSKVDDGLRRPIDRLTGAKPLFAVSGIPGTVGWGTISLWQELIPLLQADREFAVWPFEGELPQLLSRRRIVLAESYPGLAYAAALAAA